MQYQLTTIALAAMVLGSGYAKAESNSPTFDFSGFGTVGAVHSSEQHADFTASALQPDGAGRSRSVSYSVDSRLGAQLTATFNDSFSAVLQVISEQGADGTWSPSVEWANLKYQFNDDLSIRLGRIALPSQLYSNSRKVGLTNPLVRAPIETYRNSILSSNDGIDITYRTHMGSVTSSTTLLYGQKNVDLPDAENGSTRAKLKKTAGITSSLEFGDTTVRASYSQTRLTVESLLPLLDSPIPMLVEIGKLGDNQLAKSYSVAATYDPGNWFLIGEAVQLDTSIGGKYRSHYVIGGYRIGDVTPYAVYSSGKQLEMARLPGALSQTQKTVSAGVRWDFLKGADLKVQFDRISVGENAYGAFANYAPSFQPGGHANVATVLVDFIF